MGLSIRAYARRRGVSHVAVLRAIKQGRVPRRDEQIDAGLKSRTQALAERGYDAEQVDAQIAADKERERSLGLTFSSAPPANVASELAGPATASDASAH